jgi:Na+/proline symporter
VVWSDVFQGALMVLGLVLLPVMGLWQAGGLTPVLDGLRAQDPSLLQISLGEGTEILATLALLLIGLGFLGSPQIFVRFIALRSQDELRRGAAVALAWTLLADTGAVLTGMIGRHLLVGPGVDVATRGAGGEGVLPAVVEHVMTVVLVGLFIAIVLSAIMSTVDSLLVVASSAVVRDWYQKVRAPHTPDDALVGKSRVATFALAFVALGIALSVAIATPDRTVFWFVIFGWSGIAATFCPTVILSLFWTGMTARGALAAMLTGFGSVPLFKFAAPALPEVGDAFAKLSELPPAFGASLVVGVLVSLLDRRGREALREEAADDLRDAAS